MSPVSFCSAREQSLATQLCDIPVTATLAVQVLETTRAAKARQFRPKQIDK
jgi:hypothetical protein